MRLGLSKLRRNPPSVHLEVQNKVPLALFIGLVAQAGQIKVLDTRIFYDLDIGLQVDGRRQRDRDGVGVARRLAVAAGKQILPLTAMEQGKRKEEDSR